MRTEPTEAQVLERLDFQPKIECTADHDGLRDHKASVLVVFECGCVAWLCERALELVQHAERERALNDERAGREPMTTLPLCPMCLVPSMVNSTRWIPKAA